MSTPYGIFPSVPKLGVPKPLSMAQINALSIKGEINQDNKLKQTLNDLRIKEDQKEQKRLMEQDKSLMAEFNKIEKSSTPSELKAARKAANSELKEFESSNKCLPGEGCSIMGGRKSKKSKRSKRSKKGKKGKKGKKRKTIRRRR
jgi:hypothetical protein